MKTKRTLEGWLMMDHRASPGVPDQMLGAKDPNIPIGAGRGLFEAPVLACSHCQKQLIVRPDRQRERAYCRKCDHYICDECAVVLTVEGECRPFAKVLDDAQERAGKGLTVPIFDRNPHG